MSDAGLSNNYLSWRYIAVAAAALIAFSSTVSAQTGRSASIEGTISDNSGATLPGVTVILTSPVLQVTEMEKVTETDGSYRFVELPVGTYRLSYGLEGFGAVVREGIRLTAGFTARVDAVL